MKIIDKRVRKNTLTLDSIVNGVIVELDEGDETCLYFVAQLPGESPAQRLLVKLGPGQGGWSTYVPVSTIPSAVVHGTLIIDSQTCFD